MKIICNTWVSDPQVGASSQCTKPAVLVILYRPLYDDRGSCEECGYDSEPVWVGYCLDHGPEEVHEARSSMSEDEYAVVVLPLPQAQVRWRVVDNVTGMTVSREFDTESSASAICRDHNTPSAGGRYYVETNASGEWVRS